MELEPSYNLFQDAYKYILESSNTTSFNAIKDSIVESKKTLLANFEIDKKIGLLTNNMPEWATTISSKALPIFLSYAAGISFLAACKSAPQGKVGDTLKNLANASSCALVAVLLTTEDDWIKIEIITALGAAALFASIDIMKKLSQSK